MIATHPYQGHYMQDAFEGFMVFLSNQVDARAAFLHNRPDLVEAFFKAHPNLKVIEDMKDAATDALFQGFVDWAVEQFGHPDTLNDPIDLDEV